MGFWQTLGTSQWWINNIGQLVGAGIGAMSAYLIGTYQTRKQIELSQLPERIKHAKFELPFLDSLESILDGIILVLDEPGYRDHSQIEVPLKKFQKKWWEILSRPRTARDLDYLLYMTVQLKEMLDATNEDGTFPSDTILNEYVQRVRTQAELVGLGIMVTQSECIKLLGLERETWSWGEKMKYRWERVRVWLKGWFTKEELPF